MVLMCSTQNLIMSFWFAINTKLLLFGELVGNGGWLFKRSMFPYERWFYGFRFGKILDKSLITKPTFFCPFFYWFLFIRKTNLINFKITYDWSVNRTHIVLAMRWICLQLNWQCTNRIPCRCHRISTSTNTAGMKSSYLKKTIPETASFPAIKPIW